MGRLRDSPSQKKPTALFFIVARQTLASLTEEKNNLLSELEELRPIKEQLNSLAVVLAAVFILGVLF